MIVKENVEKSTDDKEVIVLHFLNLYTLKVSCFDREIDD